MTGDNKPRARDGRGTTEPPVEPPAEPPVKRRPGRPPRPGRPGAAPADEAPAVTRTLDRGLAILEAVAERGECTLSDIARATAISASTAFRLLETLEHRGYLARAEDTGTYRIGPRAFDVGTAFSGARRLNDVARPLLKRLAEELGESVALALRDGSHAMYVEQVEARDAVRLIARLGTRLPLHCTAVGKVLLAWLWEARVDELLGPPPYATRTAATLVQREPLLADLEATRRRGWAIDAQEYEPGVRCLAAPVRDRDGDIVAALSVSAPTARLLPAREAELAVQLERCAAEVSSRLGWRGAAPAVRAQAAEGPDDLFTD
jgi:DNA-binding IclR family transcriptional regulator